jgi:hypothetical protein
VERYHRLPPNVPASLASLDPDDEKWCDSHGRYTSSRKCVGNTITVLVGKRVEVVRDGMLFSRKATGFLMRYNYRRGTQSISGLKVFMDAYWLVTPEEGDRYPLGPP